jgi:tetratricopeptide (TPR) repeat protein
MTTKRVTTKLNARRARGVQKTGTAGANNILTARNAALAVLALVMVLAPLIAAMPLFPLWGFILGGLALVAGTDLILRSGKPSDAAPGAPSAGESTAPHKRDRVELLSVALIGWILLCLLFHTLAAKPLGAFAGVMATAWANLVVYVCLYLAARAVVMQSKAISLALLGAVIAGATLTAIDAVQELVLDLRAHTMERVFATSAPEFLAGYIAISLPLTMSVFAIVPKRHVMKLLVGTSLVLQTCALVAAGSQYATLSLVAGCAVLLLGIRRARRAVGTASSPVWKKLAAGIALAALAIVGLTFPQFPTIAALEGVPAADAGLIVHSLSIAAPVIAHTWLVGSGIGTFDVRYLLYSPEDTNNFYLRTACEIGLIGFALMASLIVASIRTAWRVTRLAAAIANTTDESKPNAPTGMLAALPPEATGVIAAGLAASVVAGLVQNLFDFSLQVFAIGATFWLVAGLATGIGRSLDGEASAPPLVKQAPALAAAIATATAIVAIFLFISAAAAGFAVAGATASGDTAANPNVADSDYMKASELTPLNGEYRADRGYRVLLVRENRAGDAVAALRTAVRLQPSEGMYIELANAFGASGDHAGQQSALEQGLVGNPMSLKLLLAIAHISDPSDAVGYYRRIAELGEADTKSSAAFGALSDPEFAEADCSVADDAASHGDTATAATYYRRAEHVLEQYGEEHGSNNAQRRLESGGLPAPAADQAYGALYAHTMAALLNMSPPDSDDLTTRSAMYNSMYSVNVGDAYVALGDVRDARKAYQSAIPGLLALPVSASQAVNDNANKLSHYAQVQLEALEGQ